MPKTKGATSYTADQFINAIPGTGGIIAQIAEKVGCHRHTAAKFIDTYAGVKKAWLKERLKVSYVAQSHIIQAIEDGDLQTCKWWLQVMDPDFKPKHELEHTGNLVITLDWGDNVESGDA